MYEGYDDLTALDQWVDSAHVPDVLFAVDENTQLAAVRQTLSPR